MTSPTKRHPCNQVGSLRGVWLLLVVVIGWIATIKAAAVAAASTTSSDEDNMSMKTAGAHDKDDDTNLIGLIRKNNNDRHPFSAIDNIVVNDEQSTLITTTTTVLTTSVSHTKAIDLVDEDDDDDDTDDVVVITSGSTHSSYGNNTELALSRERELQSCVTSVAALKAAVARGATRVSVCTSKIKLGSLNRRRRLGSDEGRALQGVLTGLGGGIDVSHRTIVFTCLLKKRCVLDGEGISRIFYGTNATLLIDGFQFLNASSAVNDALGSGSALTLIGSSKITVKDCSFHYNTAPNGGGAIMMNNSQLIFKSSHRKIRFLKNRAQYGGAIYGVNNAQMQTNITSSRRRRRNRRLQDQQQSYDSEDRLLVASPNGTTSQFVTFENNLASQDGGAVHFTGGVVTWDQVNLDSNAASSGGAMMLIGVQSAVMTKLDCGDNQANVTGGAFVFQDSNVTIANSTFTSNDSNGTIGAVLVKYTADVSTSTVQSLSSTWINSCWVDGSICQDGRNCGPYPLCGPGVTGTCCTLDLTCKLCCNGAFNWWYKPQPFQSYAVCGPQPCWDDWTWCIGQLSCQICCNDTSGVSMFQGARCGLPACYSDGTACEDGVTCDRCCNTATTWSQTVTPGYYCGNEPCTSDGTACVFGGTCNSCCNTATLWWSTLTYKCGDEPCIESGNTCLLGITCNACCSGSGPDLSCGCFKCN